MGLPMTDDVEIPPGICFLMDAGSLSACRRLCLQGEEYFPEINLPFVICQWRNLLYTFKQWFWR